jgi:hypothetical protein
MSNRSRIVQLAVAVGIGALLGGGGYAFAANSTNDAIHGCLTRSHVVLIEKRCSRGETALSWNQRGTARRDGRDRRGWCYGSAGTARSRWAECRQRVGDR